MSSNLVYLQGEATPPQREALWALQWTQHGIVSGDADGVVRLHDPTDLELAVNEFAVHPLAVSSLSAAGSLSLSTSLDGAVVAIDLEGGKVRGRVDTGRAAVGEGLGELPAYAAALHPSSSAFAWSGRGSRLAIRALDLSAEDEAGAGILSGTGSVVETVKGRFGMDVQFSPDGAQIAVGMETGHVVIVDAETATVLTTYSAHAMGVRTVSWSPDSQWLYSGSDDARIVLHDVRAGAKSGARGEGAAAILQGHQGWVLTTAASPDGRLLGSGGADSLVKLWDIGQRACVSTSTADAEVWGFAWQPEVEGGLPPGKQFAVAGDDKKVSLYRAAGAV
ncbi:WD repeat-containing protein 61 [Vanrija pseudolonga]|uniref:WD repeat-containing protein 61 n=1 Tax=Vanrija pseudolonga TaxID=143232 RepID=A0AAF1BKC9_9TREE|nr:WD repeat-containing protein 61 [Vanrija pseudolonga]